MPAAAIRPVAIGFAASSSLATGASSVDVQTVDECLDVLEHSVQSDMWKQLPDQEKTRLIGRMSYILEITEKQELEK